VTVLLPAWLQAGAYSAEVDRYVPTGLLAPNSSLGARGGVRRWSGTELKVVATSPATMQVVVKAGMAWIQGGYTLLQGSYAVVNDDDVTLTVNTAPSSNSRIDLVILELLDAAYSGATNSAQLRVVQGTAAASPVFPTVTGSYIVLAYILVGQNVTSISTGAVVDQRTYAAANGGILPFGSPVLEVSTGRVYTYAGGTTWNYAFGGTPPTVAITPAGGWYNWTGTRGGGPWEDLRATKVNNIVYVTGLLGNQFSFSNPGTMFTLPSGYRPERRKLIRMMTGYNIERRVDIYPDGSVQAWPGADGSSHGAGDWWSVDFQILLNNNTVG
jgi:hypothetical protein